MSHCRIVICVAVLLVSVAASCLASGPSREYCVLELKDGRTIEGWLVSDNADEIVLELHIGSLRREITIDIGTVESRECTQRENGATPEEPEGEVTDNPATDDAQESDDATTRRASARLEDYSGHIVFFEMTTQIGIELNLKTGEVKEGVRAWSLQSTIKEAANARLRSSKRTHALPEVVVLIIDSGGGYVIEESEFLETIEHYDEHITFVAVIDKAFSAAAAITLACDVIYYTPDSILGGMLAFSPGSPGDSVNQKMISHDVATFRALASSNGWDPDLVTRMVDPNISDANRVLTLGGTEISQIGDRAILAESPEAAIEAIRSEYSSYFPDTRSARKAAIHERRVIDQDYDKLIRDADRLLDDLADYERELRGDIQSDLSRARERVSAYARSGTQETRSLALRAIRALDREISDCKGDARKLISSAERLENKVLAFTIPTRHLIDIVEVGDILTTQSHDSEESAWAEYYATKDLVIRVLEMSSEIIDRANALHTAASRIESEASRLRGRM